MISRPIRLITLLSILSVWIILSVLFHPALSQNAGQDIYIEEGEVKVYLKVAHKYEAAQRWREAIEQYHLALKKYPEAVYQVEPDYYLGIRTYFHQQLLKYPEELATYREMFNATSEALYLKALKKKSLEILSRIVNEMFFSDWGDNAADALADILVEQGEVGSAIWLWNMILNHYPDSELSPAILLFKIAWASRHFVSGPGNEEWYQQAVARLRMEHLDEIIRLGSVEKKVSAGLKELDTFRVTDLPIEGNLHWPCWGGNRSHTVTLDSDSKNDIKLWEFSLANLPARKAGTENAMRPPPPPPLANLPVRKLRTPSQVYPPWCPIVTHNMVYINMGTAVLGFDLKTGKRKGSYSVKDIGPVPTQNVGRDYLTNKIFSCFEAKGTIYVDLLNLDLPAKPRAYLAAFDAVTFKNKWNTLCLNDPLLNNIVMASSPLFSNDKVYAAVVKQTAGETEVYLCCFDAASGIPLWKRFICSRRIPSQTSSSDGLVVMPTLAEANGIICCHTNQGVIAALSNQTGEILWLVNYASEGPTSVASSPISYPIITNNIVCCALPELNKVCAYDLLTGMTETGMPVWRNMVYDNPYVIGINGNTLFVQGNRLRAFDIINGKRISGSPPIEKFEVIGRGFVTRNYLYLPALSGLMRIDLETQKVVDYPALEWGDSEDGGNILVIGGYLLSVSQTRLNVFQDLERYAEEFDKKLQAQPNKLPLIKQYVQTMHANKKYSEAIRVLTNLLDSLIKTTPDPYGREDIKGIQKELCVLYIKQGDTAMQMDNLTEAITHYQKALKFASLTHTSGERTGILLKLGDCYGQLRFYYKAVAAYQQVLQQQPTGYYEVKLSQHKASRLTRKKQTLYAELKIAEIIKSYPETYVMIQQEAEQVYRSRHLMSGRNKNELITFVDTYPHSQLAKEALLRLVRISVQGNNPRESIHYLRRFIRSPAELPGSPNVLTIPSLIEVYEEIGAYNSLRHLLTWLMIKFPEYEIVIDQTSLKVQDYVLKKLSEIKTKLSLPPLSLSSKSRRRYKFDKDFPVVSKHLRKTGQQPLGLIPSRLVSLSAARHGGWVDRGPDKALSGFYLQVGPNIEAWDLKRQQLIWVTSPIGEGSNPTLRDGPDLVKIDYTMDGNLIIGRRNLIQKIYTETGKTIWSYKAPGQITSWCVGIEGIYLNCFQNKPGPDPTGTPYTDLLVCLNTRTGEVIWEQHGKERTIGKLILAGDEAVLLRWFKNHLEINDTWSGELIYQDKIPPLHPDFYTQTGADSLGKIYYFNQNNRVMAYDIYNRQQENLGIPVFSPTPGRWLTVSDKFICISFAHKVMLFNRANRKFITTPELTKLPVSKLPQGCHIRSIIEDGLIYLWTARTDQKKQSSSTRSSQIGGTLLCLAPGEGKIEKKWRTPPFDKPALDVVGSTSSQIVLKYPWTDKGAIKVMVLNKKGGQILWEDTFNPHPLLSDVRVEIFNDKLVITAEDGVYIY